MQKSKFLLWVAVTLIVSLFMVACNANAGKGGSAAEKDAALDRLIELYGDFEYDVWQNEYDEEGEWVSGEIVRTVFFRDVPRHLFSLNGNVLTLNTGVMRMSSSLGLPAGQWLEMRSTWAFTREGDGFANAVTATDIFINWTAGLDEMAADEGIINKGDIITRTEFLVETEVTETDGIYMEPPVFFFILNRLTNEGIM
ncbi:MAG: hypothetical protein FWE37_08105 [Spirochaetaceae bacterium]|nr:hypothetical protein [Spirochaetaceae bacterium]